MKAGWATRMKTTITIFCSCVLNVNGFRFRNGGVLGDSDEDDHGGSFGGGGGGSLRRGKKLVPDMGDRY